MKPESVALLCFDSIKMNQILKVFILIMMGITVQHLVKIIWKLDFHKSVYNHRPGPCTLVKGIDFGSEDIVTLSSGLALISSGVILLRQEENIKKFCEVNNITGGIYAFDFNRPDERVIRLDIGPGFDQQKFAPHGISVWEDEKTGKIFLFVVNHLHDYDTIEKFEFLPKKLQLVPVRSYSDPQIHFLNDVVATGVDSFYATNCQYFHDTSIQIFEHIFFLPWASVIHFDGNRFTTVLSGILNPNGINISNDRRYLYLAMFWSASINIYKIGAYSGLEFVESFPVDGLPDNIIVDADGNLLVGVHPVCHLALGHMLDPAKPAPTLVLQLNMVNSSKVDYVTELLSDEGRTLWMGTVAVKFGQRKMLVGTVYHKLMYCELNNVM